MLMIRSPTFARLDFHISGLTPSLLPKSLNRSRKLLRMSALRLCAASTIATSIRTTKASSMLFWFLRAPRSHLWKLFMHSIRPAAENGRTLATSYRTPGLASRGRSKRSWKRFPATRAKSVAILTLGPPKDSAIGRNPGEYRAALNLPKSLCRSVESFVEAKFPADLMGTRKRISVAGSGR